MATHQQCEAALEQHATELAARPGVVGLGIVPLESDEKQLAVAIYIDDDTHAPELPQQLNITEIDATVPTQTIVIGRPGLEPGA